MTYKDTKVTNVTEYLDWVFEHNHSKSYFRGQADVAWHLTPGLFRDKKESLVEAEMLREANSRLWADVSNMDYLSRMIFFQSFGLQTRLLDVTSNALVALYFACTKKSNSKEGGVVYIASLNNPSKGIASLYAELAFSYEVQGLAAGEVDRFLEMKKISPEWLISNDFVIPALVTAPSNNPRLEAQSGAFIIAPILKEKEKNKFVPFNGNLDDMKVFGEHRAVIPDDAKEKCLAQLTLLGIDEGTLFPDPSHKINAIKWELEIQ